MLGAERFQLREVNPMAIITLSLLCLLLPFVGGVLFGAAAYNGWMHPSTAVLIVWAAFILRQRKHTTWPRRLGRAFLWATGCVTLGIFLSHGWNAALSPTGRFILLAMVWLLGLAWLALTVLRPALLRMFRVPLLPHSQRGTRWVMIGTTFFLVPLLASRTSNISAEDFVRAQLAKTKQGTLSPVFTLDSSPHGLSALVEETRHLFIATGKDGAGDVLLVRLRHDPHGTPVVVSGIYNLSSTAAVGETDLRVLGNWAAYHVPGVGRPGHVEVLRLSGEQEQSGTGWGIAGKAQHWISNLQATGQGVGVGRYVASWQEPANLRDLQLKNNQLEVSIGDTTRKWPLGGVASSAPSASTLGIEEVSPPRPGSLVTWAVDRVRGVSWIGSERLQWFKGIVYKIRAEAEDLTEQISSTNPETKVNEELGDVWSRLPVVEESAITGWPPEPLATRLSHPLPGEGQWIDLTHEKSFSALSTSALLFTFVRVDPKRAYNQVSIALWDPRRIQTHIVAGTEEPKSTLGARGSGLVPRTDEHVGRLVGAFNGAFQAVHGEFGMMENRVVGLPPKPYAATLATFQDGTTRLGTWPALPTAIPEDMLGLRQNMTPLVARGVANPYRRHWWGGVPENWADETRTVRSAVCRTKEGYLAYFYSPSIDPVRLSEALLLARCGYGMHLDMNGGHAGFELYRVGSKGQLPPFTRVLDPAWEATGVVSGASQYEFHARLLVK